VVLIGGHVTAILPYDFEALRRRFPVLARKTYLNSGSYGALSNDVKAAFEAYLDDRMERGSDWGWWTQKNESVRTAVADLVNARTDEVAITASASAGINGVASALDFSGPRNRVVISDFEFPTNAQIWHAQEKRGAEVVHVPEDENGYIPLEHFEAAIDERTAIVAVTHVCYRNGARLDIPGIVEIARRHGALVLLDAYQSMGTMPIDVKAYGVDFMVSGMLKYMLGTAGIGFLYVREALARTLEPTVTGWFGQADIGAMDITRHNPAPNARRFETGTPPVPNCYAAEAGIRILKDVGLDRIEERIRDLTRRFMNRAREEGFQIATPDDDARRGPMVAVRSTDDVKLVDILTDRSIVTSCRFGNLRAGFHAYNNEDDIEVLISTLRDNRALMR
jgi:selenocysteine lyase/cysteine desulfurase